MFCIFCEKFENSKWPPFLARQKFLENWDGHSAEIPCGSKISSKSLYLARFLRYKHFCVLQFLRKIRKFKMAAILGETMFFFENCDGHSAEIPCGSKISSKSLYLARFSRYKHFCVLKSKIRNCRHLGRDKIFFENLDGHSADIPCGSKISSKSLYLAQFSRYKHFLCFAIFAKNSEIQNGRQFW